MVEQRTSSDQGRQASKWLAPSGGLANALLASHLRFWPWLLVLVTGAAFCWYLVPWSAASLSRRDVGSMAPARLAAEGKSIPRLVACRDQPLQIRPHLALRDVVSESELVTVLCGAAPLWNPPTVPSLIHELKLWGAHSNFTDEMVGHSRSGAFTVETLLSDKACIANTTPGGMSFLLDSPYGIRVVEQGSLDSDETRGEGHFGQLLKALAEGDVPSAHAVTTASGRVGTIADLFQDAVLRFSFARELEFITCDLVYWLPLGQRTWTNEYGSDVSFDDLMKELLARPYGKGACGGCHLPYAIVLILRLDEVSPVLSPSRRQEAISWLEGLAWHLETHQSSYGGWDRGWPGETPVRFMWGDPVLDRLTVTGHHLEWMALAPPQVLPSREVIRRAVNTIASDVAALNRIPGRSFKTLLPVAHAGRALVLLHGGDAFSLFSEAWRKGRIKIQRIGG